jgi:hypothetical protein
MDCNDLNSIDLYNLETGYFMDCLIAIHIMGYKQEGDQWLRNDETATDENDNNWTPFSLPSYSTNPDEAQEMENKIRQSPDLKIGDKYIRKLCDLLELGRFENKDWSSIIANADPDQKCRAALIAVSDHE